MNIRHAAGRGRRVRETKAETRSREKKGVGKH
jgi:hypothetical protein